MKKTLLITLAVLTFSLFLFAQQGTKAMQTHQGKPMQMEMKQAQGMDMPQDMMKELKLTEEQQKKIDQLRDEQKKYINLKQAALDNLRIDKQNAMQAEDYAKVKQINKSISDAELELANKQVDHHQAMLKELTAEQRAKMKELMPMRNKGMGMMKGEKNMMKDCPEGQSCEGMDKGCMGK
jgi:Spy/CpxP family protein refolding chaperone